MGANYNYSVIFNGEILEVGMIDSFLSKSTFAGIKNAISKYYKLSFGSETDGKDVSLIVNLDSENNASTLVSNASGTRNR